MAKTTNSHDHLTPAKLLALVQKQLPAWVAACNAEDTDAIVLHESEFGSTATELLLLACAIKYAARKGKNVYIACGHNKTYAAFTNRSQDVVTVYRDTHSRERTKRARQA